MGKDEWVPVGPRLIMWRLGVMMVVPIVLGWALAYLCVFVFRWVAAGFAKKNS
jgi:hypothetical protein